MEELGIGELLQFLGPGGAAAMLTMYFFDRRDRQSDAGHCPTKKEVEEIVRAQTEDLTRKLEDLHEWHSKEDEDGVKVWYVRRSLERAIGKLSDAVEHLSRNQDRITDLLERALKDE